MKFTLSLGEKAIDFSLLSTEGKAYSLKDFSTAQGLVLFFTCNHCPYVQMSDEITRKTVDEFKNKNIAFVGINSNSQETYEEDSFPHMVERMETHHFPWIYLYDETQEVARAYGALRTPHFYLFDQERRLIYCGAGVDSPRDPSKVTVNYLEQALKEFVAGKSISIPLANPIGCNVKWKGHDAHWMPPEACDLVARPL